MIDVSGLPTDRDPAGDDFAFDLGNGGDAAAWSEAPAPTFPPAAQYNSGVSFPM